MPPANRIITISLIKGRFPFRGRPFFLWFFTMPDETITIQPDSHAAQVETPANAPIPDAPIAEPTTTTPPVIAIETSGHSDQLAKDGFFATVKAAVVEAFGDLFGRQEKAVTKREDGVDYPKRDFAYTPTEQPSTWKLRLAEGSPGNITVAQLGRAAAAFSAGGFRGNRVQLPAAAVASVKRRIRSEYTKLGVKPEDMPASVKSGFTVWKAANGQYRWLAVYSNNYRDNDNPPEIISEKSHLAFLSLVKDGVVPYPELWHWHIPGTRWGVADMLDYADGFAIASGTVDAGHEKEAEALADMEDIRVSHGMPAKFIVRNPKDKTVIDFHITSEISPLPGWAAANKMTEFVVFEELDTMALRDEQKEHLRKAGLTDERITQLETELGNMGKAAQDAGIESKETETETPAAEVQTETPAYATEQGVADAIAAVTVPITEALQAIQAQLAGVDAEIKALKASDEAKIAKAAEATPRASLQDLIAQSIIGNKDAQVDGRTALAKAGPKQAEAAPAAVTGITRLDEYIRQSRSVGVAQ